MKRLFLICLLAALLTLCGCGSNQTEEHALERLEAYAQAIDYSYKEPGKIYAFLCQDFRDQMDEEAFCEAFAKERTYPYLTPLYISKPEITLSEDGLSGTAVYLQAARLVGMTYEVSFVYENGDYYIQDWEEFLDGSYLEKFDNMIYSLDWYYSEDVHKN
jgi:hypothetical protein